MWSFFFLSFDSYHQHQSVFNLFLQSWLQSSTWTSFCCSSSPHPLKSFTPFYSNHLIVFSSPSSPFISLIIIMPFFLNLLIMVSLFWRDVFSSSPSLNDVLNVNPNLLIEYDVNLTKQKFAYHVYVSSSLLQNALSHPRSPLPFLVWTA